MKEKEEEYEETISMIKTHLNAWWEWFPIIIPLALLVLLWFFADQDVRPPLAPPNYPPPRQEPPPSTPALRPQKRQRQDDEKFLQMMDSQR